MSQAPAQKGEKPAPSDLAPPRLRRGARILLARIGDANERLRSANRRRHEGRTETEDIQAYWAAPGFDDARASQTWREIVVSLEAHGNEIQKLPKYNPWPSVYAWGSELSTHLRLLKKHVEALGNEALQAALDEVLIGRCYRIRDATNDERERWIAHEVAGAELTGRPVPDVEELRLAPLLTFYARELDENALERLRREIENAERAAEEKAREWFDEHETEAPAELAARDCEGDAKPTGTEKSAEDTGTARAPSVGGIHARQASPRI